MRLAIITDIHEDIISLKEALRKIERFRCDEIVCLGDISGFSLPYYNYYPTRNAHECLSLIRSVCSIVLLGNHDIHAAGIIPEHCNFFEFPDNWYQLDYHQRHKLGNDTLWLHEENDLNPLYKGDDLEYLRSLPEYHVMQLPERNILLTHYVYPNTSGLKKEFYTYGDEFDQHFNFMAEMDCTISFTGHVHIRGFFTANGRRFKQHRYKELTLKSDPVCIGLPPITRLNNRSGFCIFDTDSNSMKVIKI
jgi:predicted phosphodiesterase